MNRPDDLPELKRALAERAETFVPRLLPNGKRRGREWTVGGLDGSPGDSLSVCLSGPKAGVGSDFATGAGFDNLLELLRAVRGCSFADAIREAREWLGLPAGAATTTGNGNGTSPAAAGRKTPPAPFVPVAWPAKVAALTPARLETLAAWRGLSSVFCGWLHGEGLIGWHNGGWAFPVHDDGPATPVTRAHYRGAKADARGKHPWFYEPAATGGPVCALVIGNPAEAGLVHVFESPWDALAAADRLGIHTEPEAAIVVTRGASNGRLAVVGLGIRPGTEVFAWRQNDAPGDKWLADVASAATAAGLTVREVATPPEHADPNDWTRAGATADDLLAAVHAARPVDAPDVDVTPAAAPGDLRAEGVTAGESVRPDYSAALLTARDLDALSIPPRRALLDRWFCEADLGFLYAQRGVGKTWLALLLSRGVSGGEAAGPWKRGDDKFAPGVLYVDGEMPLELLQTRQRGLGMKGEGVTFLNHDHLFTVTEKILNLSDPAAQQEITRLCLALGKKFLVLDNLSCLFRGVSENDADAWEMVLPWLLELRRLKIAVLIVAHAGRNNAMRGTSRREDAAAWILRLDDATDGTTAKNGARFVSSFAKASRNTPENLPPLEWTITTDVATGRSTVAYKEASGEDAVFGWVRNGLTSCKEIAAEMGVSPGAVSKMAACLIAAGKLKKDGRGYAISLLGDEAEEATGDE